MKRLWQNISIILTIIFVLQLGAPVALAAEMSSHQVSVLCEKVDEAAGRAQQVAKFEDLLFFSYTDEDIAYSAQITPQMKCSSPMC